MDNISIINTDKFKDVLITLRFASEKKYNNTIRTLLSIMLVDKTKNYNSKSLMRKKLDNMFGATLNSNTRSYGQSHIIEVSLSILNAQYVKEDLLDSAIEFLSEIIYNPLLNKEVFAEAKLALNDMLERESDNLGSYTLFEAMKVAGENYPLAYMRNGDLESLKSTSLEDVIEVYNELINKDNLSIIIVGDVKENNVNNLFNKYFKVHNTKAFKHNYLVKSESVKEVVATKETLQAYYSIIYNTNTLNEGRDYWTLQLFSMVLGGLPNSLLFMEVREKRSLGYSISAGVVGYDGVLYINGGVLLDSVDLAVDVSLDQVERIKNNDFDISIFEAAKVMLINSIYQGEDVSRRIVDSHYRNLILNENTNTEKLVELINDIDVLEIVDIASKLQLNTIYKLINKKE